MGDLEDFKENIETEDTFNIKDVVINKSTTFNCNINMICETPQDKIYFVPPMATACIGIRNTAASEPYKEGVDYWTDWDAQEKYLNAKPTNYIILSKPGAGAFSLGEALSKKFKCIHLCPRNILMEEMEQNSLTGKCFDFNMRHNKVIYFEYILSVIRQKINMPAIQHRGYILSGLPLIPAKGGSTYFIDTLYSEDSLTSVFEITDELLSKVGKKKSRKAKLLLDASKSSVSSFAGEEEAVEEEHEEEVMPEEESEDLPIVMPKFVLEPAMNVVTEKRPYMNAMNAMLVDQLDKLFQLPNPPNVAIYITCPDADIVTKKYNKYYDYKNDKIKYTPFICKSAPDIRWPLKYTAYTSGNSGQNYNTFLLSSKYLCVQPFNLTTLSNKQICNYHSNIQPVIEHHIQLFDPKFVIKLNGCMSTDDMLNQVLIKSQLIPIKPIVIPQCFYLNNSTDLPESTEEFWKSIAEMDVISTNNFKMSRFPSAWFNRCPVELKRGKSIVGKLKFAVSFFKHLYLLYSYESMVMFCMNPYPFLKLQYLQPTCRIAVLGTKSSGKTMISQCLSWLFDAKLLSFNDIFNNRKSVKFEVFAKIVLPELTENIMNSREGKWQEMELERETQLEEWLNNVFEFLNQYVLLYKKKLETPEELNNEEINAEIEDLKTELRDIPNLDDIDECMTLLSDKENILCYAPQELTTVTKKPDMPQVGDDDVTEAVNLHIVSNELQAEIEPIPEELIKDFSEIIAQIDDEVQIASNYEKLYGKWVIDDFPASIEIWTLLYEENMLPDYTVFLMENRELTPELMKHYIQLDRVQKSYPDRILNVNDPLVQIKLLTNPIKPKDTIYHINQIIEGLIDSTVYGEDIENVDEYITTFTESIDKYRECLDDIRLKTEEKMRTLINVELEEKDDIVVLEEVLRKLRQGYNLPSVQNEEGEYERDDNDENPKDFVIDNDQQMMCETNIYCPIAFYDFNVIWEGKSEFSVKHNNKFYCFCKEDAMMLFQQDPTKYQSYNKPHKKMPPLRLCIVGCIGSGRTTLAQNMAKELGLLHVDFSEVINELFLPRHFKKVGRKYENPFIDVPFNDEEDADVQVDEEQENEAELLSNEMELRRSVYNYFELGTPLSLKLLQKLLKIIWLTEPYSRTGIVLDGFPRLNTDVEAMVASYCVPDLIIEVESDSDRMMSRISQTMFKKWKNQLNEAKRLSKSLFDKKHNEWLRNITQKIVMTMAMDDIIDNVLFMAGDVEWLPSVKSMLIDAEATEPEPNFDPKLVKLYKELVEIDPEPIDDSEWENPEEALEKLEGRLESLYAVDDENLQSMKDLLEEAKVKVITVDGEKPVKKLFRNVLLEIEKLRIRNESFFEQTFIINNDVVETSLDDGLAMNSIFNHMCPVHIYENPTAAHNPYKLHRKNNLIYPVLHRSYVYFICGKSNLRKFRMNPLKYICNQNIYNYLEFPLRIGIIGPPKSGKSTLAKRITQHFGVIPISKGTAIRYVLENMCWTDLAKKMLKLLTAGVEVVDLNLIIKAIQLVAMDYRTLTHGFVLDGIPETSAESVQLRKIGLHPLIIFQFKASNDKLLGNAKREVYYHLLKRYPPYSFPFIENRLPIWDEAIVEKYINNTLFNVLFLNCNETKWDCWANAKPYTQEFIKNVHHYLLHLPNQEKALSAAIMCISKETFENRMSQFKNFCPSCLEKKVIRHNDWPIDREGLIQYRNTFYWICPEHLNATLTNPSDSLLKNIELPEAPAVITHLNKNNIHENGICIVTYAENLPAKKIERGIGKYAAGYKGKHYLFCDEKCLKKFMETPYLYYDIIVFKHSKLFTELSITKLPHIGYLEQSLANILTEACCHANVLRPKYPGLGVELSALIFIALYLKTHNTKLSPKVLPFFVRAYKVYEARCKLIIDLGLRMRAIDNPLTTYPTCCSGHKRKTYRISDTVSKPSSIFTPKQTSTTTTTTTQAVIE